MIKKWQKECIQLYARNTKSGFYTWSGDRCSDEKVLGEIEAKVNKKGGDYMAFIRMMEDYYDAERCPAGDYGTGNPHRDMEASAYDSAWRSFEESCSRFGLSSDEVYKAIRER